MKSIRIEDSINATVVIKLATENIPKEKFMNFILKDIVSNKVLLNEYLDSFKQSIIKEKING